MKKINHTYCCPICNSFVPRAQKATPPLWIEVCPPRPAELSHTESFFLCPKCSSKHQDLESLLRKEGFSPGYVPYMVIEIINCDGQDCHNETETVIGPPHRIPIGVRHFPWTIVTGGLGRRGERHYCPKCMEALEPQQKPVKKDGPHDEERPQIDVGGILKIY